MSFLMPGTSTCFICDRPIATRIEAAQLEYASSDDVGDVARHGRAWVHRSCWQTWPTRDAWRASTRRLMAAMPNMTSVRNVTARPAGANVLLVDASAPFSITVPRDQVGRVCDALQSTLPTTLMFDHVSWEFSSLESRVRLTASQDGSMLVDLVIEDAEAWCRALAGVQSS
jgi:hypothetical protein